MLCKLRRACGSHLVSRGILALALFSDVEPQVLQQDDGTSSRIFTCRLDLRANAVLEEVDIPALA